MIHMLKHNNHLKHNNTNTIQYTVRELGTTWSIAASKMTGSNVKPQQYCTYNSDMN